MGLFSVENINKKTKLAVWKLEEPLDYFNDKVPSKLIDPNRIKQITHDKNRYQHLAGRFLLGKLLKDTDIEICDLSYNSRGKLFTGLKDVFVSVSHCKTYASAIVSDKPIVGVDVERVSPRAARIMRRICTEKEIELIGSELDSGVIWGAKEAVYKAFSDQDIVFPLSVQVDEINHSSSEIITSVYLEDHTCQEVHLKYKLIEDHVLVHTNH